MMRSCACALVVAVTACGSSSGSTSASSVGDSGPGPGAGSTTVNGNVLGSPLPSPKVSATIIVLPKNTKGVNETPDDIADLHVSLGSADDFEGFCSLKAKKAATGIRFDIAQKGQTVTVGDYAVVDPQTSKSSPGSAIVSTIRLDATCRQPTDSVDATAGTITITAIDAQHVEATFTLTLRTGDKLSGAFSSPLCAPPGIGATPACQ